MSQLACVLMLPWYWVEAWVRLPLDQSTDGPHRSVVRGVGFLRASIADFGGWCCELARSGQGEIPGVKRVESELAIEG